MATKLGPEDQIPAAKQSRQHLFVEIYPDYFDWLDGDTWELDYETDIHTDRNRFVAALRYQARENEQELTVKTVYRVSEDGTRRKVLLVRAYRD
jgi:hypothetical protein